MATLYPLRFQPVFKHYLWGGHRLRELLRKPVAVGQSCAESWEICDRRGSGGEQSVVSDGPLAGLPLSDVVDRYGAELLGRHAPLSPFPLLIKFLDAEKPLSVQVHPDDARARLHDPPDRGKAEAWVVLAAEPGAVAHIGLKPGVDREAFARAVADGTCADCLERLTPSAGDCIFLPAGMVHALGSGLTVAEVQQSSDTTYRLFDWNRVGPDGRPRELRVEQGLAAIDFSLGPGRIAEPRRTALGHITRLVSCDYFVIDRWQFDRVQVIGGDDRANIIIVVEGEIDVGGDPAGRPLSTGDTMLIPASVGVTQLVPRGTAVLLNAYLP